MNNSDRIKVKAEGIKKYFYTHDGQIVRADQRGIGVRFKTASTLQEDLIEEFISKVQTFQKPKS